MTKQLNNYGYQNYRFYLLSSFDSLVTILQFMLQGTVFFYENFHHFRRWPDFLCFRFVFLSSLCGRSGCRYAPPESRKIIFCGPHRRQVGLRFGQIQFFRGDFIPAINGLLKRRLFRPLGIFGWRRQVIYIEIDGIEFVQ